MLGDGGSQGPLRTGSGDAHRLRRRIWPLSPAVRCAPAALRGCRATALTTDPAARTRLARRRQTVAVRPKIGVLVMALLEDDYNKTAHMRPAATAAAREIADALGTFGDIVHAGLVEEEEQAAAAARLFNAEDVDIIVALELAYTKGLVPARCLLETSAPVLVWNTQKIPRLGEDDGFDVVMLNSGMAGMPELTAVLVRTKREFALVTSRFDDPDGRRRIGEVIAAAAVRRRLRGARVALVGHPFEGMTDLMFDGLSLRQEIGPVVWPLEPEKVALRFGEIAQADVDALTVAERARYTVEMEPALFERSVR